MPTPETTVPQPLVASATVVEYDMYDTTLMFTFAPAHEADDEHPVRTLSITLPAVEAVRLADHIMGVYIERR